MRLRELTAAIRNVAQKTPCTRAFTDALADADIAYGQWLVHDEYLGSRGDLFEREQQHKLRRTLRSLRDRHMTCLVQKGRR